MRIAIYSRKSKYTGKGESVENQLTMCREYLTHVIHIPEDALILEYEDEGFSGKNTNRPGFLKMLADMEKEHFDYLVCYKLDRLGRNLLDLTTLMERLERDETSFISIKERFDTTTPIGKAMLYFSGVLAQMEREQIGERVRDNMLMLARDGRWLGGNTPYGFTAMKIEGDRSKKQKTYSQLLPIDREQMILKEIFGLYLKTASLNQTAEELQEKGYRTRRGKSFTTTTLRDILSNPVYCICDYESYTFYESLGCQLSVKLEDAKGGYGFMAYGKTTSRRYKNQNNDFPSWILAKAIHKGVISSGDFIRTQKLLLANSRKDATPPPVHNGYALLSGLLYCSCGSPMRAKPYASQKDMTNKEREFFYICRGKEQRNRKECRQKNLNGNELDDLVWNSLPLKCRNMSNADCVEKREYLREKLERITIEKEGIKIRGMDYNTGGFHEMTIALPHPLGPTMATNSPG